MKTPLTLALLTILFIVGCRRQQDSFTDSSAPKLAAIAASKPSVIQYGIAVDSFEVQQSAVASNWTLTHLLAPYLDQATINEAAILAKDSADLKYIAAGHPYSVFCSKKDSNEIAYCVYEKNASEYVVFDFTDKLKVIKGEKPVTTARKEISGIIEKNSNLSSTIQTHIGNLGVSGELTEDIASIYAWSIDFFKLYPGDKFKIIYEEHSIEGKPIGIGEIPVVYFQHRDSSYYAFKYEQDSAISYFDEKGKGLQKAFLKAPLKFSRVSSGYTLRRFHPVQKRWKAHLGTDYAAPTGTPILATADGTIMDAKYKRNNGNYVKIHHSKTYQTGYLHMNKIGKGIKAGVAVRQGQVIGYVGSTGLATGPHVCYRFWKNGKQVDARAQKFQSTKPIKKENMKNYLESIEPIKTEVDQIEFREIKIES